MIEAIIYLCIAALGAVVWLVRVEGSNKHNLLRIESIQKQIDSLQIQIDSHSIKDEVVHTKMLEQLSEIKEAAAEIKGFLKK